MVDYDRDPQLASQDLYGSVLGDPKGILLPPFWDEAMSQVCGDGWWVAGQEWLMRRMMREIGIFAPDRIYRALLTEGEHSILPRVQEPAKGASRAERQRYKRALEAQAFTEAWTDRLQYSLKSLCWDLCEAFAFGSKLAEAEYAPFTVDAAPFRGGAYVAPIDIAPKPRTVYQFLVDRSNRVVAARPFGKANQTTGDVPRGNLLILSVGGADRDPTGEPILASLYRSWHRKQRAYDDESKTSEQSSFIVVGQDYAPAGAQQDDGTVQVQTGTDGSGNPIFTRKSKLRVAAESIAAARRGMTASMPPGMNPSMLEAKNNNLTTAILDRSDRDFARGYLGAARQTQEAQFGSKADSNTASDVAETMRDWGRGKVCGSIEEFFAIVLALNFGDKYSDVVPVYDIVTEEGGDMAVIGNFFAGNWDNLTLDQKNFLAAKVGMPPFQDEEEPVEPQPTDTQDEKQIAANDNAASEADVKKFVASFGDSARLTFATKIEIANGAANRRIGGKNGVVRSADRQFRSLVTRLSKGNLTEEEFRTRFDHTLQVAHERAYKIGVKHASGDEALSAAGDEYVASLVTSEGAYAADLAAGIADGSVSLAGGLQRARMYANRARGSANEGFREASVGSGEKISWELGGVEEHCSECPIYADLSPWEPDELFAAPGEGKTPCMANCRCHLVRTDGKEGFRPVDFSS